MTRTDTTAKRRGFLKALGVSAGTAAAAGAALAPKSAAARESAADARRARYQADSQDVRRFYDTNGYETLRR
jgi:hypothetical protein